MSERAPLVSVIVPTYNHERYVEAALRSILDQTFRDLEIIVVNDGSTDGTSERIRRCADPRLVHIDQENQGPSIAVNRGIAAARGRFLALMSGDDVSHLDRIERQVEACARHGGVGVLFSSVDFIDDDGKPITGPTYFGSIFEHKLRSRAEILRQFFRQGNFINPGTFFAETSLFRACGAFDPQLLQLQDFDMWIRLVKRSEFHFLPENTLKYRIRDNSQNLSAPTTFHQIRSSNEYYLVMKRFFDEMAPELFLETFHDDLILPNCRSTIGIACEQAFLFAKSPTAMLKLAGVEKLYGLLGDSAAAAVLHDRYQFNALAFMRLLSQTDSFNVYHDCRSVLYVETDDGASEPKVIHAIVDPNSNEFAVTFSLDRDCMARQLRWHPVENRLGQVRIERASWRTAMGNSGDIDLASAQSNGALGDDGMHRFESGYPLFFIPFTGSLSRLTIQGRWQMESVGASAARLRMQRDALAEERDAMQRQRDALQSQMTGMMSSRAWRIASKIRSFCRRLAAPARLLQFAIPGRLSGRSKP